jgi:hypothetical protein
MGCEFLVQGFGKVWVEKTNYGPAFQNRQAAVEAATRQNSQTIIPVLARLPQFLRIVKIKFDFLYFLCKKSRIFVTFFFI